MLFNMALTMILSLILLLTLNVVKCLNLDTANSIIYNYPRNNERLSYFGMSLALRPKSTKDSWVVQIGSPRSNVTGLDVKEPGTTYRCRLHGPCEVFVPDREGNVPGVNWYYRYKDRKDEAWTGISMDMKLSSNTLKTVICGSRWSNQNLTNDDRIRVTYLMTGVCYLQEVCDCPKENYVQKLLPLVNPDKIYYPKPYAFDKSFYYWGLGQSGISSVLLDDLSAVIMGAPGYSNWLGTVIQYNTDPRLFDFRVGLFEDTKEFKSYSYPYIGYQVSYGRFFGDKRLWLLASAPRSENYHGKVIIFQFKDYSSEIYIASEITGSTFGEYFGASLAVSDINNDGLDDLVVGAPLFFRRYPEEGRIYVYLGTNRGNFLFRSQIINGRSGYSRFGNCVASLNDLDQDGFRDIAVGAPYENNNHGAVYIFKGSKKGLEMEFSQRISAEDIHHGLLGFGISLFGVDVDENKYVDLAIGAYLSDQVVIVRSRPIIHLHPVIQLEDISLLDRKAVSFNISVCSRYTGSNAPSTIRILRTVEVDAKRNRASLATSNTQSGKSHIILHLNEMKCELLSVIINNMNTNYEPLLITLKSELPSCNSNKTLTLFVWDNNMETKDSFDKWCPIGKKRETYIEIPFAGECGTDNICQAELELSCDIKNARKGASLVVTSEFITLNLDLKNTGEPGLNTEIIIQSNIDLISSEYTDEDLSKRVFHIDVAPTFVKNFHASFSFRIATDSLDLNDTSEWGKTHLKLRVEARSKSVEDLLADNICDINFNLLSDSVVDLYSSSTLTGSFDLRNTTQLNFTLYHEIQKKGGTPVSDAELNIYIPGHIEKGSKQIEFVKVQVETSDWMYASVTDEEKKQWEGPSEVDITWLNINSSNVTLPAPRTIFLNCSAANIRCKTISVVFPDGIPSQVSSQVKMFITIDVKALDFLLEEKDIIHFTNLGALEYKKLFETEPLRKYSQSSVTFYKEEAEKRVEPYVIALSVIAGGLLLSLIVTALVRSQFFRRKKKEELQALKSEELKRQSDHDFPPEIIQEEDEELQE